MNYFPVEGYEGNKEDTQKTTSTVTSGKDKKKTQK